MALRPTEFDAYLRDVRTHVLAELERHLPDEAALQGPLYRLVRDYPLRPAKMLRPGLCIAVARAAGGSLDEALPTACALEMYHNAFLIHDDVEDGSDQRRGQATLSAEHGAPIAINVGDTLVALALGPLLENTEVLDLGRALAILEVVAEMARRTAEGQAIELAWTRGGRWDVTDAEYIDMVERKTAIYTFMTPIRAGGIIGRLPAPAIEALVEFGRAVGIAFQIRDDLLNLVGDARRTGKERFGDLREGKRTLILGHFFRTAPVRERRLALRLLERASRTARADPATSRLALRVQAAAASGRIARRLATDLLKALSPVEPVLDSELQELVALIVARGSIAHAASVADEWRGRALHSLASVAPRLGRGEDLHLLESLCNYSVDRPC